MIRLHMSETSATITNKLFTMKTTYRLSGRICNGLPLTMHHTRSLRKSVEDKLWPFIYAHLYHTVKAGGVRDFFFILLNCEKWLWVCRFRYLPVRVSNDQGNPTHQWLVQPRKETVWKLWKPLILKVKHLLFFRFQPFPSSVCSCYYPAP